MSCSFNCKQTDPAAAPANPWRRFEGRARIAPSLLSCDFMVLGEQIAAVEARGCDLLHVDVMDGHFVPNLAISPGVVKSVRARSRSFLDVHLMLSHPLKYAESFVKAGADSITFHVEAADEPRAVIDRLRELGVGVGVVVKPATAAEAIADYLPLVDLVLVMTVEPGFGGQSFMADQMPKLRRLKAMLPPGVRLEVDGGVDAQTIVACRDCGADTFVAGNSVFGAADIAAAYDRLAAAVAPAGE